MRAQGRDYMIHSPPFKRGLVMAALGLAGCAVGPDFKSPTPPTDSSYTATPLPEQTASAGGVGGAAQHFVVGADIPDQWWTLFHSQPLDNLVREALKNSPSLGAAQAALKQARETLSAERGGLLLPSISADGQGVRERASGVTLGLPYNPELTVVNATLDASYNLDVFGGARRQIEGYASQVDYARYQLEATYLTLTSSVVATAVREASLRGQLKATEEIADAEEKQLAVVQRQYAVGAIPRSAVLSQQTQLAATRATLPSLQKSLIQTRDQLALLIGRTPANADLPVFTLEALNLPTDVPVSLPANLVRQRPDIQASEAQLHAASAQVGVATAALFPQFTLTAQYGREALGDKDLFIPGNTIWSLAGGITQPLFRGGQLTAERRAAIAAYDAASFQYRSVVLQAFQNVADTLQALESDAATVAADTDADALARQTLDLTQAQYRLGAVSYLALLDAQRQYYQAHVNLVQAQAARYTDTATLFQALGGGWWNRPAPVPEVAQNEQK